MRIWELQSTCIHECDLKFVPVHISIPKTKATVDFRETKDTVRVSLQEYLFTGSSKATSCGFRLKRVRLPDLLEGRLTVLPEPSLTVLLVLPKIWQNRFRSDAWGATVGGTPARLGCDHTVDMSACPAKSLSCPMTCV